VIQQLVDCVAIAVLAASGAVVGVRKEFDLFGICTLAVLTGVGGGVLRDLFLDLDPPTSLQHWQEITICLAMAVLTTVFTKAVIKLNTLVLVLDAVGMGFFATSGAAISIDHGASWFAAAVLGVVSAIAGSVMRDVVARDVPMVMGPDDMYAAPAVLGSVIYVAVDHYGSQALGVAAGSLVATLLRLAAITFHWRLPTAPRELINHVRAHAHPGVHPSQLSP
jgi:uncharacterized membrane protein YeiH